MEDQKDEYSSKISLSGISIQIFLFFIFFYIHDVYIHRCHAQSTLGSSWIIVYTADALKMETTLNKYQQVSSIVQLTLQDEFGKKNRGSWKIT